MAGLLGALTLVTSSGPLCAQSQPRVSIDWRNVSDADVERCGLSRLRAGTLERLVDEGHAVVDSVDSTGISVRVSSVAGGLHILVKARGISREDTVTLPQACDATLVLEAISRIAELVRDVEEALGPAPAAKPIAPAEPEAPVFQLELDAAVKAAHPREFVLFGGGFGVDWAVSADWRLGGRAELTGNARLGVTVLEASTLVTLKWRPLRSIVGLHLEAGPLFHSGTSSELAARELDAAAGAGPDLSIGPLRAHLLGYVRLRRFEHRIDGEVAFDTRQVFLILRIGAQLFGS